MYQFKLYKNNLYNDVAHDDDDEDWFVNDTVIDDVLCD